MQTRLKKIFYIFTFLLLLIPTSEAFACGNASKKAETEQTSCEHSDNETEKKSCCDSNSEDYNGCNGGCKNTNCHCPVNIPIPSNILVYSLTPNMSLIKINWPYMQNATKPVYLSIWQPPKTS